MFICRTIAGKRTKLRESEAVQHGMTSSKGREQAQGSEAVQRKSMQHESNSGDP